MKALLLALLVLGTTPLFADSFELHATEAVEHHWDVFARCDARDPWELIGGYTDKALAEKAVAYIKALGCEAFLKEVQP